MFSYAVPVSNKCHQNDVILIITLPIARHVGVILSKSEMRNESTIVFLSLYFSFAKIGFLRPFIVYLIKCVQYYDFLYIIKCILIVCITQS